MYVISLIIHEEKTEETVAWRRLYIHPPDLHKVFVRFSQPKWFKEAPYSFLKGRKHTFQIQTLVHWYFVRRMKLTVWYRTDFWELETVTKKCVTVVAMATMAFQNGC